jgi:oligoendopeptidase F
MSTETPVDPRTRTRADIPEAFTWNLADIYAGWDEWEAGLSDFERQLAGYADLRGSLAQGSDRLLKALHLDDDLGQLSYKLWHYAGLTYDQDQRDNSANARRQRVQILFAKAAEAKSWFTPELLRIPLATVRGWMQSNPDLAVYRFAIERVYHQQEHVLDEKGEHLLSLSNRFGDSPHDIHSMLANADIKHPVITQQDGTKVTRRRFRRFMRPSPPMPIPTPLSTTACYSATGSSHRHGISRPRWKRRFTEMTSPPPWSRTSSPRQKPERNRCGVTTG